MEDILAVYATESVRWSVWTRRQKQLLADTRLPIAMKPGQPARRDYEYEHNGTAKFMIFAPLEAWRRVKVTDWRTAIDCAQVLEDLSGAGQSQHPQARIVVRGFSSI